MKGTGLKSVNILFPASYTPLAKSDACDLDALGAVGWVHLLMGRPEFASRCEFKILNKYQLKAARKAVEETTDEA